MQNITYHLPKFYQLFLDSFKVDENLLNFLNSHKSSTQWIISSDYCLEPNEKKNHISLTFTIFPHQYSLWIKTFDHLLGSTYKADIKKSFLGEKFCNFVKLINALPIFSFSLIMDKNFNPYGFQDFDQKKYFRDRYDSVNRYYSHKLFFDIKNDHTIGAIKRSKTCLQDLNNKNCKLNIYSQIDLCTTIVSALFTTIIEVTNHSNKLLWCSDRDNILTYNIKKNRSPVAFDMISHDVMLNSSNKDQYLCFFNKKNEDFDNLIRIPDFITGTLSDMSTTDVSHKKYIPVIHECLTNKEKISILKLVVDEKNFTTHRINLSKINENIDWKNFDFGTL